MHACEAEFRLLALDAAATPTLIAVASEQGVDIRYANRAFHDLYGVSPSTSDNPPDLFAGPSDRGPNAAWRIAVRQGRATRIRGVAVTDTGAATPMDVQVQPLDGDQRAAALYLRPQSDPELEPKDVDMAMAALDATAEELCLRDAEAEIVFSSYPGVLLLVDRTMTLRAMGGEALRDLGVRETPDQECRLVDAFPDGSAAALLPLAENALANRKSRFSFYCASRSFEGVAAPVRLDNGEIESAVLALHDVTDRNEAYAALSPTTSWSALRR